MDAVTLCTPIRLHYEQGLQAIEAGKHVHFNKTMTTTAAEATDLIERAESAGVKLVASPGEMLRPLNVQSAGSSRAARLGDLGAGDGFGTYHEEEPVRQGGDAVDAIDPSWYWRKPGGGPLYDMTVYGLHALTGILGPAKRVGDVIGLEHREFQGVLQECTADDNSLLLRLRRLGLRVRARDVRRRPHRHPRRERVRQRGRGRGSAPQRLAARLSRP